MKTTKQPSDDMYEYLVWSGRIREGMVDLHPGILNITITLHGPPSVTSTVQTCLNIRSLREYLARQIKEEVGNIAKVGTLALMCKVQIEEAIDNDTY